MACLHDEWIVGNGLSLFNFSLPFLILQHVTSFPSSLFYYSITWRLDVEVQEKDFKLSRTQTSTVPSKHPPPTTWELISLASELTSIIVNHALLLPTTSIATTTTTIITRIKIIMTTDQWISMNPCYALLLTTTRKPVTGLVADLPKRTRVDRPMVATDSLQLGRSSFGFFPFLLFSSCWQALLRGRRCPSRMPWSKKLPSNHPALIRSSSQEFLSDSSCSSLSWSCSREKSWLGSFSWLSTLHSSHTGCTWRIRLSRMLQLVDSNCMGKAEELPHKSSLVLGCGCRFGLSIPNVGWKCIFSLAWICGMWVRR